MESLVAVLVLAAAVLHASWNAMVKSGGDPFLRLAVVMATGTIVALPPALVAAPPAVAAWPWLAASVVIHNVYYVALAAGYRAGDLSLVYPIARGIAPPLVALGAWILAGERLGLASALAILLIATGLMSLALAGGRHRVAPQALALALLTGLTIAGYTICDGQGGRSAGSVIGYIAWLFVLEGIPFGFGVLWLRRRDLDRATLAHLRPAAIGGVLACLGYGLVIWAMSLVPMAHVSALRETSVLVAALLGAWLLKEPFGARRIRAAALVAAGVVLLQLSQAGVLTLSAAPAATGAGAAQLNSWPAAAGPRE